MLLNDAKERDVQDLLREANAVLNKFVKAQALQAQTNVSVGTLDGTIRSIELVDGERSALLDSGASHPFRAPRDNQEHHEARNPHPAAGDGDESDAPPVEEEDEYQRAMNQRFQNIYKDIGDNIEHQSLQYVVPLKTKTAVTHGCGRRLALIGYTPRMEAATHPTYESLLDAGF